MLKQDVIQVKCFNQEIGKLGLDGHQNKSFFQYNPQYLQNTTYKNLFPDTGILKHTLQTQIFTRFDNETFKSLPPVFADSLPDVFGNIIFKKWLESRTISNKKISVLEQLSYVGERGMGALEYHPIINLPSSNYFNLEEVTDVLQAILNQKTTIKKSNLNQDALLHIFKIGTSAGGVRPKILISENKTSGEIIPGDIVISDDYHHYLVKLFLDEKETFNKEILEYCYYLCAIHVGICMMPCKLIEDKHFASVRYDRQNGEKQHVLTASGLTGWDFKTAENSSYENLFELALFLKIPPKEIDELFKRMVFNVVFCNTDDHLKNHSFIYNPINDNWNIAPAYDITYALNPFMNYKRISRALSIQNKRFDITIYDILKIADKYSIKNAKAIVNQIQNAIDYCIEIMKEHNIPLSVIQSIQKDFNDLT